MARDKEKYQYLLIGLLKDSDALRWLLEDARQHHMEDQLAKLAAIRLTEYYEQLAGRGGVIPLAVVARLRDVGIISSEAGTSPAPARQPDVQEAIRSEDSMVRYSGDSLAEDDKRLSFWEM